MRGSSDGRVPTDRSCYGPDPDNIDYAEYQAWLAAGNVPDPYVAPPAPPYVDANARIDAGIEAALAVAEAVKAAMQNIPDQFSATNYTLAKIQLDALTQAVVAMLQAQAAPAPPP